MFRCFYGVDSLIAFAAMTGLQLDFSRRVKAVQYLLLRWRSDNIAQEIYCHPATIYRMQANIWMYNIPSPPRFQTIGCPRMMIKADEDLLIQFFARNLTANQQEMV
jgi:hypothetical protein